MNHQLNNGLQYMRDVGVPDVDVAWLADYRRLPVPATAEELMRAKQIEDAAYIGLLGTIKNHYPKAAVCQ